MSIIEAASSLEVDIEVVFAGNLLSFKCFISAFKEVVETKVDDPRQPWELGKKYDGNFIFTFAVVKVRYGSIMAAKIFKH